MSKLFIAQVLFALILAVALLAMGMQIFGLNRIDPDILLPWAYTAAVGWFGSLACPILRLIGRLRGTQSNTKDSP